MGSSESTQNSPSNVQAEKLAQIRAHEALRHELIRQKAQLEEEKIQWQQQQIREQHWKESQLREEQKLKETLLEWRRQEELRKLKLQQQKMQKELEEQTVLRRLEKEKLQKQLEKERLQNAQLEEDRLLLQRVRVHQQQQFPQVCMTVAPVTTPLASFGMRETVTLQQKVLPGSAASPSSSIAPRQTTAAQQKPLPAAQPIIKNLPKPKETPKSYLMRMNESNVKCNEWSIIDYIKDENSISKQVSENLLKLFNDNNTIPFIARYRRHLTQRMNEDKLRKARHSYDQAKLIKQRAITIVKDIDNKGLWTPEFHALVHETKSLDDLEHIHSIFKTPKSKIIKNATENGLGIVADACLKRKTPPIAHLVQESVEGLKTQEQVKDGIICLLVDIIIKDRRTFNIIKELRSMHRFEIQTTKGKGADKLKKHENIYEPYYNFTLSEHDLKPDQVRDINKGEALKTLSVKIIIPEEFECEFKKQCLQHYGFLGYVPSVTKTLIDAAINFAYTRSIKGFVAKRVRKEISDKAAFAAVEDLAIELAGYLFAPPVRGKVVIGINPGFQNGCKFAVVSEQGNVLDTGTIYPNNANNPKGKSDAENVLVRMICKHKCKIIALGNGKASKETTVFLTHIFKKNKKIPSDVFYTIVDKSSASIYSCSREAALEFPNVEAEILSAVSIARRLQDPLAELVKIDLELTVEKHQQEIYQQMIVELVSYVGVDVNTASLSLLKRVAGLNEAKANSIIEWRKSCGPFTNRNDLLKVKGINKSTFEQCAGFIRIVPETAVAIGGQAVSQDSFNYLDQTCIHPESYDIAKSFLEAARCNVLQLGTCNFIFTVNLYAQTGYPILAKRFGTTEETIKMIVHGLRIEKGQDVRGKEDSTMFCKSLIRFNDLNNGDLLTGVVTHLAEFGAFVDVSAEIDGLLHKSCMNGLTVKVGQKVEVRVSNIQKERGRLGLTLVQCL